jgi:hypothetical protein
VWRGIIAMYQSSAIFSLSHYKAPQAEREVTFFVRPNTES